MNERNERKHRSMLGNDDVIRDVNQSVVVSVYSSTMSEWLMRRFIRYNILADDNMSCC